MKRFWDHAHVVEDAGRFAIRLDGRPMRLPGGPALALESRALAEAIAAEWSLAGGTKGGTLTADDVPLTRIAGTAQERVAPNPAPVADAIAAYGQTDLLCYRAEAPAELVRRQVDRWQPWVDWAARTHGAQLRMAAGVVHVAQPEQALAALHGAVSTRTPFALAGLGLLVPSLGSLVLGLAVADGALDGSAAHELSILDELFQAEKWGEDREAITRRRHVAADIETAARFIALSSG
jgi:chaperone required for assembly of F1-ATPase